MTKNKKEFKLLKKFQVVKIQVTDKKNPSFHKLEIHNPYSSKRSGMTNIHRLYQIKDYILVTIDNLVIA